MRLQVHVHVHVHAHVHVHVHVQVVSKHVPNSGYVLNNDNESHALQAINQHDCSTHRYDTVDY